MIQDTMKDGFDALRGRGSDDVLAALGLTRKGSSFGAFLRASGIFLAGIAAGTGLALLLAPRSGQQLRHDIRAKARALSGRIGATAGEMAHGVRASLAAEEPKADMPVGTIGNGSPRDQKVGEAARQPPLSRK